MRFPLPLAAIVVTVVAVAGGCGGGEDATEGLARGADKARDASAFSTVQQALATTALIRSESGGGFGSGAEDLARRLQAKDPSKRYSTAPSAGADDVQVLGGGAGPAMLMVKSPSGAYVGAWTDGAATVYYRGAALPAYSAAKPDDAGWSATPLQ